MADEEKESTEDKEAKPDATGAESKGSAKKWIIIGVVVLLLGGGGYAAWDLFLAEKLSGNGDFETEEVATKKSRKKDDKFGIIYALEPFIVNLLDKEGKRYLKAKIEFELEGGEEVKEIINQRVPQLRDAILMLLTSKAFADISKPDGKLQLKNEMIVRINQLLPGAGVRTLYFTEFVIQ